MFGSSPTGRGIVSLPLYDVTIHPMEIRAADGLNVVLNEEHWEKHIVFRHPELRDHRDHVIETLTHPEGVFRSKRDQGTRIYIKSFTNVTIADTLLASIPLLVHVREEGGFVVTSYFAASMWRNLGERIWPL